MPPMASLAFLGTARELTSYLNLELTPASGFAAWLDACDQLCIVQLLKVPICAAEDGSKTHIDIVVQVILC